MRTVVGMAMEEWAPKCVVLDLRELQYEWGDAIGAAMHEVRRSAEIMIIASEKCRAALASFLPLMRWDPDHCMSDTMDRALERAHTRMADRQ